MQAVNPAALSVCVAGRVRPKLFLQKYIAVAKLEKHAQRTMHRKVANVDLADRSEENLLF